MKSSDGGCPHSMWSVDLGLGGILFHYPTSSSEECDLNRNSAIKFHADQRLAVNALKILFLRTGGWDVRAASVSQGSRMDKN